MGIVSNPQSPVSKSVVSAAINGTTTSATSTSGTTSTSSTSAKGIASNFNQFLQLLTTQLQHQDPTAPLDANQFTQQLVQFSQVEQQLSTNAKLDSLVKNTGGTSQISSLLGYVGLTATTNSATASLTNGQATWTINSPKAANSASIIITDSTGTQINAYSSQLTGGKQDFVWDGKNASGSTVKDGVYQIKVVGKDSTGTNFIAPTLVKVKITGIDNSSGTPLLIAGNQSFTTDQIQTVSQ